MKVKLINCFCICILIFVVNNKSFSTSNCDQKFTLLGITEDTNLNLYILEEVGGECQYANFIKMIISKDQVKIESKYKDDIENWDFLISKILNPNKYELKEKENTKGVFTIKSRKLKVSSSKIRKEFKSQFSNHINDGGGGGGSWNRLMGEKGVDLPQINGTKMEMLYYYQKGLYINYDIDNVFYFPKSGHLLVFTNQSEKAVGLDTMHGFLILKKTDHQNMGRFYSVQIKAFPIKEYHNAVAFYDSVKSLGHFSYCTKVVVDNKVYVRVRVGCFENSIEADQFAKKYFGEKGINYYIAEANFDVYNYNSNQKIINTATGIWLKFNSKYKELHLSNLSNKDMIKNEILIYPKVNKMICYDRLHKIKKEINLKLFSFE